MIRLEVVGDPSWVNDDGSTWFPATWWYRVVASNGQIMLTSEMYASKSNAVRAANRFARYLDASTLESIEVLA